MAGCVVCFISLLKTNWPLISLALYWKQKIWGFKMMRSWSWRAFTANLTKLEQKSTRYPPAHKSIPSLLKAHLLVHLIHISAWNWAQAGGGAWRPVSSTGAPLWPAWGIPFLFAAHLLSLRTVDHPSTWGHYQGGPPFHVHGTERLDHSLHVDRVVWLSYSLCICVCGMDQREQRDLCFALIS